jgi:hypothetical protein
VLSRKFLISVFAFCVFSTLPSAGQVASPASLHKSDDQIVFTFQGTATGNFQAENEPATTFAAKPFTIIATTNPGGVSRSVSPCAVPAGTCTILTNPSHIGDH